jgi:hypothetical protein
MAAQDNSKHPLTPHIKNRNMFGSKYRGLAPLHAHTEHPVTQQSLERENPTPSITSSPSTCMLPNDPILGSILAKKTQLKPTCKLKPRNTQVIKR